MYVKSPTYRRKPKPDPIKDDAEALLKSFALHSLYSAEDFTAMVEAVKNLITKYQDAALLTDLQIEENNILFVLDKFDGCETLKHFESRLTELEIRSCNFMKPLGLK